MFVQSDVGLVQGSIMSRVAPPALTSLPDQFPLKRSSTGGNDAKLRRASGAKDGLGIHASASEIHLPLAAGPQDSADFKRDGIKRAFSEGVLPNRDSGSPRDESKNSSFASSAKKHYRRRSTRSHKEPKASAENGKPQSTEEDGPPAESPSTFTKESLKEGERKIAKSPGSLRRLARRGSWILGSRSPSPSERKIVREAAQSARKTAPRSSPDGPTNHSSKATEAGSPPTVPPKTLQRRNTGTTLRSRRPLSAIMDKTKSLMDDGTNFLPSLPKSYSNDRLPLHGRDAENLPDMPKPISKEMYQNSGLDTPRKKDELSSNFRHLEAEYHKFASKPGTLKTNVIRGALLPFLRIFADHPSNTSLRAEDLDRRVNIFNKWWMGLLEMLNGRNGQSISASDRPAVLEGLSTIMSRPEWRLPLSAVSTKVDKSRPSLKSRSSSSLESNISDFLAESVIHNVRNIFIQNLLSQMAYVVDKMSLRSAPASVVNFCGKASTYAFFFCPGVAEILVRLWCLSTETIRRVLQQYQIARNADLTDAADEIERYFPSHLRSLSFTSTTKMARSLRAKPILPLNSAYIPWNGPWTGRWIGRDSDLFFCFSKWFHVLSCGMLPENPTLEQKACAPCTILVHAQLLSVMDATIHRAAQMGLNESVDGPLNATFDDLLGADASALTLPARAPNTTRLMAENRLIMLLREILSTSTFMPEKSRTSFAETFVNLLKATATRISLYDHNACFTLCDFLEEALIILSRFYGNLCDPGVSIDWDFWLEVLKQMSASHNTMTDVRLYAFIYSQWGYICKNEDRKRKFCFDWLLEEDYALRHFNHWCPMVRAYYMRVLCWRVLRFEGDGEATAADLEIYELAHNRLRTVWSHFLFNQREASNAGATLLSTQPSNPAPGRRLIIIRNDSVPASPGYLPFESMEAATVSSQPTAYERYASLDPIRQMAAAAASSSASSSFSSSAQTTPDTSRSSSPARKRWNALKSLNPFSSSSPSSSSASASSDTPSKQSSSSTSPDEKPKAGPPPPPPTATTNTATTTTTTPAPTPTPTEQSPTTQSSPTEVPPSPLRSSSSAPPPPLQHPHPHFFQHSFKFSLEWADRSIVARERKLAPPKLPAAAQLYLQSHVSIVLPLEARKPGGGANGARDASKYGGRALAEWAILVNEYQNFVDRRKLEGVPSLRWVETPTLDVESFRRPVG